jgi:hypothetical protein
MADVVYLHVGAPKTGTTYLQDRLYANRTLLAEHGIHYPVGVRGDMFGAAIDLIDKKWGGQREGFRGEWDNLMGRVRRASGTAIVSHEILAGATAAQVARAMSDVAEAEVHLVYSARDIARQVPAEWQESVKHRYKRSFKRYLREVQSEERRDSSLWFWRAQGLPDVLNRWAVGLPPERVHLVTVPQAGAAEDELWLRYCRALGIDPALAPQDAGRANPSIGIDETALVRELNRRLRQAKLDNASYRHIVRQLVVHETLAERPGMRRVTLPPAARPWAEEVAEEWLAWVEGAGIDVVGDVDDLRPRFPDDETAWQNPDRPRPRRVADAALDALVALVVETAERPDPDQSAVARISRAARRLRGQ